MLAITNHTVKRRVFTSSSGKWQRMKNTPQVTRKWGSKNEIKRYESKQIAKGRVKHSGAARQFDNDADFRKSREGRPVEFCTVSVQKLCKLAFQRYCCFEERSASPAAVCSQRWKLE